MGEFDPSGSSSEKQPHLTGSPASSTKFMQKHSFDSIKNISRLVAAPIQSREKSHCAMIEPVNTRFTEVCSTLYSIVPRELFVSINRENWSFKAIVSQRVLAYS